MSRRLLVLEGKRLVEDALRRGIEPIASAITPSYIRKNGEPGFPCIVVSDEIFKKLSDTDSPQGIIALVPIPWAQISESSLYKRIIVLDGVQDPGNVGTIVRTAEAFGFGMVIVTGDSASPFSPKAVRASMGSCLGVKIARASISQLKAIPHAILSLTPYGRLSLDEIKQTDRIALCLGREGTGISPELMRISKESVSIPISGVESLNVAIAAGIAMAYLSGLLEK